MDPQQSPKKIVPQLTQKSKQIYTSFPKNIKQFYHFHGVQMVGSMFPITLVQSLFNKLFNKITDVGQYFQIVDQQQKKTFQVRAIKDISAQGNIFVVEHALSFRFPNLRPLLSQNTNLIKRLTEMLKYHKDLKPLQAPQQQQKNIVETPSNFTQLQFDNMNLTELSPLQFPKTTIILSLILNNLTNQQQLIKKIQYLDLKILWLNDNPFQQSQKIKQYVTNHTKIQLYNSKFTKHCTEWTLKYLQTKNIQYAYHQPNKNIIKLNLDDRNIYQININIFNQFPNLHELSIKGHEISQQHHRNIIKQILQTNPNLKLLKLDYYSQISIFQMFKAQQISKQLAKRILINGHSLYSPEPTQTDLQIDQIQKDLFKIAGCYRLASTQQLDQTSIWYVCDQLGSAIEHSDAPNVKMIPFLYSEDNKIGQNMWAYSIFWPVKPIAVGDFIYRDYLHGLPQDKQRSCRLAIWYQLPLTFFKNRYDAYEKNLKDLQKQSIAKITNFYKQNTQKQKNLIKKRSQSSQIYPSKLKLVTDLDIVQQNTTHKQIQLVKNAKDADIVWLSSALDQQTWLQYKDRYYINQFPYQSSLVMKHNLAQTIQSTLGTTQFLMRTYDLQKQLPQFIGDYYHRSRHASNNLWILKPNNMARSMDMVITDNLSTIIKNMETGPKIAQKYIENPVLRQGRKVDLRYILLLKSVSPLTMFLYKHFWIRSSNNPYTTDCRYLSTYETQFTVMNYNKVADFKQIKYTDFIAQFQADYSPQKWSPIHQKIKKMLRNTGIAANTKYPQMQNDKSRAMYGIDVMIDASTMQPKLLQITFCPDCKRAANHYPAFFNEVIQTLFLDIIGQNMQRII